MTVLRLIADDLTGALDSAAQFTAITGPLPVLLDPPASVPEGSFALSLSCRDGTQAAAVAATRETMRFFAGADLAFKKIDSLLRGHWAAELEAIVRTGAFKRIVLAPAFPAQGRITRLGRQMLVDDEGLLVIANPAAELALFGIPVRTRADDDETAIILLDASSEADLERIAERYAGLDGTLWCGAAGLAGALAGRAAPIVKSPESGRHLVLVGSDHSVTRSQIDVLAAMRPDWLVRFDADGEASASRVETVLRKYRRCVALPDIPPGLAPSDAALRITAWLENLCRHLAPPSVLTVVGGETFAALCRSLGAAFLTVGGNREPGIPASLMSSGQWQGTRCFSKSGAFGSPAWLLEHLGLNVSHN